MAITHVVFFGFKPTVSEEQIVETFNRLQHLEQQCVHPTSSKPYIKSLKAGGNNSPEGLAKPYTHAFVVEFEDAEDRDYYVDKDPAHNEFKNHVGELLAHLQVVNFEPGNFAYK
ncbi:dabb-domain-containing protein [Bimuria novae-zelandiae CBS 107.79]|uniref:Dabb-domain-containing protein n=1 Tax=Bimuria novae-zelandiae CBS 107.79 TaxID=1447943 RepID=A0A6A5VK65_9PLEO|nr:dabb-domain-containing protein [Bimuria novae-zelandiae CBS 107.79]